MSADEKNSLADQAAAWVPPWARQPSPAESTPSPADDGSSPDADVAPPSAETEPPAGEPVEPLAGAPVEPDSEPMADSDAVPLAGEPVGTDAEPVASTADAGSLAESPADAGSLDGEPVEPGVEPSAGEVDELAGESVKPEAEPAVEDVEALVLESVEPDVEPPAAESVEPEAEPAVEDVEALVLESVEPDVEPSAAEVDELAGESVEPDAESSTEPVAEPPAGEASAAPLADAGSVAAEPDGVAEPLADVEATPPLDDKVWSEGRAETAPSIGRYGDPLEAQLAGQPGESDMSGAAATPLETGVDASLAEGSAEESPVSDKYEMSGGAGEPSAEADAAEPDAAESDAAESDAGLAGSEQTALPIEEEPKVELSDEELRGAVEAILLIVDEPVTEIILAQVLDQPVDRIAGVLARCSREYAEMGRGFELRRIAGGWRLYTRPEYAGYVEKFVLDGQQVRLTQAALETLAVVAYKQPVTRSRISAIRGVNCDGVVRTLVARGLIEECGSEPESGAFLYRTTTLFLEKLGLDSVDELPPLAPFLPDDVDEIADAQR